MTSDMQSENMADPGGALIGKVGVSVLKAVTPGAMAWLKTQVMGKTVLFVGPSRAGKTSLINYIRSAHYTDPSDHTPRTQTVKNVGSVQLKSSNDMVSIELKKVIDTKGQDFAEDHAKLVSSVRPHAICVMLDASSDWSSSTDSNRNQRAWLEEFADTLCEQRENDYTLFNKIKSFSIFLNKADLVDKSALDVRQEQARLIVKSRLIGSNARIGKLVNVKPLSLIEDYEGGKLPVKASLTLFTPLVRD